MSKQKVDFDEYTAEYNQLLREGTGFFSESEAYFAKYKVDILRREVSGSPRRVLEYGCGIGRNIPFLKDAFPGAEISGSDISGASLQIARAENPDVNFYIDNADFYADEPYDVIFIAGVFHHIPVVERVAIMLALYQRLRSGGVIIIFEHNPFNPVTRRIVNNCPYDRDAVLLRPSELKSRLINANFLVRGGAYCLFVPPSLPLLLPLENMLGWLPLGGQYWLKATRG